jgi:hypothetical protein
MHRRPPIGHERDCIYISGLIPAAIADIVYVVRQRQKARLSAIVKKGYLVTVAGERRLFPALFLTTSGLSTVENEKNLAEGGPAAAAAAAAAATGEDRPNGKRGTGNGEGGGREREVLSRGRRINEPRSARSGGREGGREGKRDREKVTKVHFIDFWVAALPRRCKRAHLTS